VVEVVMVLVEVLEKVVAVELVDILEMVDKVEDNVVMVNMLLVVLEAVAVAIARQMVDKVVV
tara:strand:+ start:43 stop:228 length:186 start_codon:yes stop_codon:yes gene_type:complete